MAAFTLLYLYELYLCPWAAPSFQCLTFLCIVVCITYTYVQCFIALRMNTLNKINTFTFHLTKWNACLSALFNQAYDFVLGCLWVVWVNVLVWMFIQCQWTLVKKYFPKLSKTLINLCNSSKSRDQTIIKQWHNIALTFCSQFYVIDALSLCIL